MMRILLPLSTFLLVTLLVACNSGDESNDTGVVVDTMPPATAPAAAPQSSERSVWVDKLNLRKEASTGSAVVAKLNDGDKLTLTGRKSEGLESVVLRGALYQEPWYEVTTAANVTGWVFGGAIKSERETKGNREFSRTKFNYPYFGEFDLDRWEADAPTSDDAGDFARVTNVYRGDGQVMTITRAGGEYGMFNDHVLKNTNGDILRERHFVYNNETREITEEVIDYMGAEPMLYRRKQTAPGPYQALDGRAEMALGDWENEVYQPGR